MTSSSEQTRPTVAPAAQVRRAWIVLGLAALGFAILVGGTLAAANWVYRHATESEPAHLTVVSGNGALVRSPADVDWRLVTGDTRVSEGDLISTALGTVVTLRMFDGSTVEVTEDTVVRVSRMRSSRFLKRTKLIVLEPERGSIYIGMAPRGDYRFSEVTSRVGELTVTMSDEAGRADAGSYLVEVRDDPELDAAGDHIVRVAVLHGAASVRSGLQTARLETNQQLLVDDASFDEVSPAVRELLVNGTFQYGLSDWVEFEQTSPERADRSSGAVVELDQDETTMGNSVVVEFARIGGDDSTAQVGIRQRIGKTLRVHTSLLLSLEARILTQHPAGGGENLVEFPLTVQINYIDVEDQEQMWSYSYFVLDDEQRHIPQNRATKLDLNRWQRIIVDMRDLSPLPKQIVSIVVYASGQSYQTRIANLSLTTSELATPGQ